MSCEILDNVRPVTRLVSDEAFEQFSETFRMKKPVIFTQEQNWTAEMRWSPQYLTETLNNPQVNVYMSNNNRSFLKHELCSSSLMDLGDVLGKIFEVEEESDNKLYCRIYLDEYPELANDIDTVGLCRLASIDKFNEKNCGVWISSKGCETPLHYDLCHGFLAQVVGRKRFFLSSPDETQCMYRNTSHATKNQTSSRADLALWLAGLGDERKKFPSLGDAQWFIAELGPGDVLYTPPGWWHQVLSEDSSISVLLPFDMVPPTERLASLLCC